MYQMAPLSWLSLFIYFSMIFLIFNTLNYFSMNYNSKISLHLSKKSLLNWKW